MASRRMFSIDVINTDKFLEMPTSAQNLYFHLGMRADDEGFVSSPKQIARMVNSSGDDLKLLIAKEYLIPFESGVMVITDWKVNNYIQSDRFHSTRYLEEKQMLACVNNVYTLDTECIQLVSKMDTQDRLGKDRLGKDRLDNTVCPEPEASAPDQQPVFSLPLNDGSFFDVDVMDYKTWKNLYPAVNVEQELKKMYGWLDANPSKRKTRRGIKKFINSWLTREQDNGSKGYRNSNSSNQEFFGQMKGWVDK